MEKPIQPLLLPFHFGSIDDQSRLLVEKEMLQDPEILVEYFDLKRNLECAAEIPAQPSVKVWNRIESKFSIRKKTVLTFSFALALAACLALLYFQFTRPQVEDIQKMQIGILFDSGSELLANSNVL